MPVCDWITSNWYKKTKVCFDEKRLLYLIETIEKNGNY
jgi:hypothetical protein